MSIYDLAFPDPTRTARVAALCAVTRIDPEALPRLRDAWVERVYGEVRVAFYTRAGGDNRVDYAAAISALRAHPQYLSDRDDRLDTTYATFRFRVLLPGTGTWLADQLAARSHDGEVDTDQRWTDAFDRVSRGDDVTPAETAWCDQVTAAVRDAASQGTTERIIEV